MKSKIILFRCSLLFTACLILLSLTSAIAQDLLVEWERSRYGEVITMTNHMTVVPGTGVRYVIAEDGYLWRLIKYDEEGNIRWGLSGSGSIPEGLVYRDGSVYILSPSVPSMTVLKYDDLDTRGALAWSQSFFASGGSMHPRAIIADPIGNGVIITGEGHFDDAPRMGLFNMMNTYRIFADGTSVRFTDFNLGSVAAGSEPSPRAMCADAAGNVYITGLSDGVRRPDRPYDGRDGYISPSSLFVIKYDNKGSLAWPAFKSPVGPCEYGFDIKVDATGIYVLGQSTPAHYNLPDPLLTGSTTLRKLDLSDGHLLHELITPSRIREWPNYLNRDRTGLVLDAEHGNVFVAYDASDNPTVKLEQYNGELARQWSRDISIGEETHFNELIRMSGGLLAIGLNNKKTEGTEAVIGTYTSANILVDRITLNGIALTQIQPDASNKIHAAGLSTNVFGGRSAYEAKIAFSPYYPIVPMEVSVTEHLHLSLNRIVGLYWENIALSWTCESTPCAPEFMASMTDQNGGWKEIITKPVNMLLPPGKDYAPFTLALKKGKDYVPVYQLGSNLPGNGIKSIDIKSDWEERTLSLSIDTDGTFVPVTLSMISSSGKVLGELTMDAPGEKVFSDRFKEPVASILFSTPVKASMVSFYPNPSNGQFKVNIDKSVKLPAVLTIHDGQGLKIHQQLLFATSTDIMLNTKNPGLYVARVSSDQGVVAKTIQIK
ncbi:MAG: T9SS type A sorting domain-containing protein [Chryseolinea sp.]